MKAKFIQDGKTITITAGSAGIAAGAVITSGSIVGVAKHDIPANTPGAIALEGVYDIVKASADDLAFGADVYWNAESGYACASASGLAKIGTAVEAAGSGSESVKVKIG